MTSPIIDGFTRDDCVRSGWNNERELDRNQHNPAQLTGMRDLFVARIVLLQGGTANTANVLAALQNDATIEAAIATINAL